MLGTTWAMPAAGRKEELKGNCPKTVPDSVFKPRYSKRATSFDMSEIVSERKSAAWPTYGAQSYPRVPAAMLLFKHCLERDAWEGAHRSWLCCLLEAGVLFRRVGTQAWFFSLGPVQGLCLSRL